MERDVSRSEDHEAIAPGAAALRHGKAPFRERRKAQRPKLAEIRRGAELNLLPPSMMIGAARLAEFLIVAGLGFAIYLAYVEREGANAHFIYLCAVLITAATNTALLQAVKLYNIPAFKAFISSGARIAVIWSLVIAGMMSLAFFVKVGADFSRFWIASWYAATLAALFIERLGLSLLVRRWMREGRLNRRAVIVGGGAEAVELIKALEASHNTDIRIAGIFDDRGADRVSPVIAGYPKLGNIDQLVEFARNSRIDLLIVSLPSTAEKRVLELLKKLWVCRSISSFRRTTINCGSGRIPIPISATSPSSTLPTSQSPNGIMSPNGSSTRSWWRLP